MEKRGDTHTESFRLYKEGQSIAAIAKTRKLAISTIEGHLTTFVRRGDIKISELVSGERWY
ncbi:MAG: helix-turn-helix domain-containing protein [Chitinophagaceae bacterium]|nr:helix-turn-helix domain-containing protein [Chitinophagaceae bacterium]